MAKLMKPLFINGMYNKEGKRIRVNYYKTGCIDKSALIKYRRQ